MRAWGGSEEGPKHPSAALRCDWRVHNYVHWEGPAGRRKAGCSQTDVPSAVRVSDIVAPGPRARGVSFELGFRVLVLCCSARDLRGGDRDRSLGTLRKLCFSRLFWAVRVRCVASSVGLACARRLACGSALPLFSCVRQRAQYAARSGTTIITPRKEPLLSTAALDSRLSTVMLENRGGSALDGPVVVPLNAISLDMRNGTSHDWKARAKRALRPVKFVLSLLGFLTVIVYMLGAGIIQPAHKQDAELRTITARVNELKALLKNATHRAHLAERHAIYANARAVAAEKTVEHYDYKQTLQNLALRGDVARMCQKKRLLFLGDSTMLELMWELIFSTSCDGRRSSENNCSALSESSVPQCANERCMRICKAHIGAVLKNDSQHGSTTQWQSHVTKCRYRCFAMSACRSKEGAAFVAAKIPFMADFVWAGSAEVILNGGGIASVMSSREWLDYLREVTGTAELHSGSGTTLPAGAWKYDAVIVATGLHDLHERVTGRISVESALDEYRQHLSSFLQLLSPLAPNRVFLSINHVIHPCELGFKKSVPLAVQSANAKLEFQQHRKHVDTGWILAVDPLPRKSTHCGRFMHNTSAYGYSTTAGCGELARCVARVLCGGQSIHLSPTPPGCHEGKCAICRTRPTTDVCNA